MRGHLCGTIKLQTAAVTHTENAGPCTLHTTGPGAPPLRVDMHMQSKTSQSQMLKLPSTVHRGMRMQSQHRTQLKRWAKESRLNN